MKKLLFLICLMALGVSCSKVERQNSSNKEVSQYTQQIVSKEADDLRDKKYQILKSEKESLGTKIEAANDYFLAFDFQLSPNTRDEKQLLNAVRDFKAVVTEFHSKIKPKRMSPLKDGEKQSDEQAFYALAASLDAKLHDKGISFYDIVRWALRKEEYREDLKSHEAELVTGKTKVIMIDLMKARMDIQATLALRELTDEDNKTLGQHVKGIIFDITGGLLGSIDLPETYTVANDATKDAAITFLDKANKVRKILKDIGKDRKLHKTLRSAFSKIDMRDRPADRRELTADQEEQLDKRRERAKELIDELPQ
jgi:hypothetical protein